ncbi:MAG: DUF4911 domain-containing protein [Bacillota bacterium]
MEEDIHRAETDTHKIVVEIPEEEIVFADMVFKSYPSLAELTINHDEPGVIYLDVTEGTRERVLDILEDLGENHFPVKIREKRLD